LGEGGEEVRYISGDVGNGPPPFAKVDGFLEGSTIAEVSRPQKSQETFIKRIETISRWDVIVGTRKAIRAAGRRMQGIKTSQNVSCKQEVEKANQQKASRSYRACTRIKRGAAGGKQWALVCTSVEKSEAKKKGRGVKRKVPRIVEKKTRRRKMSAKSLERN